VKTYEVRLNEGSFSQFNEHIEAERYTAGVNWLTFETDGCKVASFSADHGLSVREIPSDKEQAKPVATLRIAWDGCEGVYRYVGGPQNLNNLHGTGGKYGPGSSIALSGGTYHVIAATGIFEDCDGIAVWVENQ